MEKLNEKNDPFLVFVRRHENAVRFLFIGSINTVIDLTLYAIFANLLGIKPVIASIMSTGITLCFSFFMNHYFVFKSGRKKRHTALLFVLVTLCNVWVIQSSVIALSIHLLDNLNFFQDHIWTLNMLAKVCGISVSLVLNYVGYKMIFKNKDAVG